MQPIEVPPRSWHTVTADHITGLPTTDNGNTAIAVFVDKLTKYLVACSKESTAEDWANMFVDRVYVHHGLPENMISDRGTQFTSAFTDPWLKHWAMLGLYLLRAIHNLMARLKGLVALQKMC